jgi:hypothetical protein
MIATKKKKVITNGDTTFYQFDNKLGFWGVPNLEREVCFHNETGDTGSGKT